MTSIRLRGFERSLLTLRFQPFDDGAPAIIGNVDLWAPTYVITTVESVLHAIRHVWPEVRVPVKKSQMWGPEQHHTGEYSADGDQPDHVARADG